MLAQQIQLAEMQVQIEQFKVQSKAEDDSRNTDIKEEDHKLNIQKEHNEVAFKAAEVALEAEQERPVGIGN